MRKTILIFALSLFGCMAGSGQAEAGGQESDSLYRAKCTACHRLYPARKHTYRKLQVYVARYGKGLNDEERMRLLKYLSENAKEERVEEAKMDNN
jgi:hypothetical protein